MVKVTTKLTILNYSEDPKDTFEVKQKSSILPDLEHWISVAPTVFSNVSVHSLLFLVLGLEAVAKRCS